MTQRECPSEATVAVDALRVALKSQYHAGLAMLREAVDKCPDELWAGAGAANPFWQNAYHALFFTHLYLMPDEASFRPWEQHREEYQFLGALPWPPHRPPNIGEPYTKDEVISYWAFCDRMIDEAVDALDLNAPECGFWWYKMPKVEHQMMNLRHLQHHAAQLSDRLRAAIEGGVGWKGAQSGGATSDEHGPVRHDG